MASQRGELAQFLLEIKQFFGEKWFEAQCEKAGQVPIPEKTHPVIYSWIQTSKFLHKKKNLPGLKLVPTDQILTILMLASYLRLIQTSEVVDLEGGILDVTTRNHFQKRLRSPVQYHSAFYEIQVACLYLREGHKVAFIHDKRKSPEFFINVDGQKVYVECKRIAKPRLDRAGGDTARKLKRNIKNLLIDKKLGVIVVCPSEISNPNNWIGRTIRQLAKTNKLPVDEKLRDYYFTIFNAASTATLPGYDTNSNITLFYQNYLNPILDKHMKKYSVSSKDIVSEVCYHKLTPVRPPGQVFELDGYFGVAFKSLPAIILGIKKSINKAYRQLPKNANGIIYIETPPYSASNGEIDAFWGIINERLNSISRINALVLTGRLSKASTLEHISNVVINRKCGKELPQNFSIIPLKDKFGIKKRVASQLNKSKNV